MVLTTLPICKPHAAAKFAHLLRTSMNLACLRTHSGTISSSAGQTRGLQSLPTMSPSRDRNQQDLDQSIARHTTFDAAALLTLEDYPGTDRIGAFYGQSAGLVKYLVNQKGPREFIAFLRYADSKGIRCSPLSMLWHRWCRPIKPPLVTANPVCRRAPIGCKNELPPDCFAGNPQLRKILCLTGVTCLK
jgi:hypothetical protein